MVDQTTPTAPSAPTDEQCDAMIRYEWDCRYVLVQADLPIYRAIYRAALAAPAPPREPTPEMVNAGIDAEVAHSGRTVFKMGTAAAVWRAMYDAAPAQEQAEPEREILAPLWAGDGPGVTCRPTAR